MIELKQQWKDRAIAMNDLAAQIVRHYTTCEALRRKIENIQDWTPNTVPITIIDSEAFMVKKDALLAALNVELAEHLSWLRVNADRTIEVEKGD